MSNRQPPAPRKTTVARRPSGRPQRSKPASRALVRQMIRSADQSEIKYIDATTFAGQVLTTTMTTTYMSAVSQGTNASNRVGIETVSLRVDYRLNFVVGDATNVIRFMVLYDSQPNGATFSQTDLFINNGVASQFPQWEYKERFAILHDEFFSLDTYNPQVTKVGSVPINRKTRYSGSSNAITAARTGAIFVVFLSDSNAVPQPTVSGDIRYWFRDG